VIGRNMADLRACPFTFSRADHPDYERFSRSEMVAGVAWRRRRKAIAVLGARGSLSGLARRRLALIAGD
jgi:hypothetical protein